MPKRVQKGGQSGSKTKTKKKKTHSPGGSSSPLDARTAGGGLATTTTLTLTGAKRNRSEREHDNKSKKKAESDSESEASQPPPKKTRETASSDSEEESTTPVVLGNPAPVGVTIAHREDARGAGAFWDHFTVRSALDRATTASYNAHQNTDIAANPEGKHGRYSGPMPGGNPPVHTDEGQGLLFIPGGNYGLETEKPTPDPTHRPRGDAMTRQGHRAEHERELLRRARLTGRPVLAVCGGSWRLLEAFGGTTRRVETHTHQTRIMPYLTTTGQIARVASEHPVTILPDTMLSKVFRSKRGDVPGIVNTAHWAVAEEPRRGVIAREDTEPVPQPVPPLAVSARAPSSTPPYMGRDTKERDWGSVEGFETTHGAPMMGIQWHPEAYNPDDLHAEANRNILNWMAKAGDAYEARRHFAQLFEELMRAEEPPGGENPPVRKAWFVRNVNLVSLPLGGEEVPVTSEGDLPATGQKHQVSDPVKAYRGELLESTVVHYEILSGKVVVSGRRGAFVEVSLEEARVREIAAGSPTQIYTTSSLKVFIHKDILRWLPLQ
ncbi:gamma-glutamyl-gamma-aminobutyrate hydrolase family protein [Sorangium cellulosum]|uniref:gamma-glutamyl-gamma-aminobutyrate hydrolase family protein n=1 Tax=Sorangium cellulosum TaxID=56 RepID=UPI003D9C3EB1